MKNLLTNLAKNRTKDLMKPEAISKDIVRSFLYFFFVLICLPLPVIHGGVYANVSSNFDNNLEVFPSSINTLFETTQTAEELTGVSISSNNPNSSLAKAGDDVSLIFTTNQDIENVNVVFQSGSSAVAGSVGLVENPTNTWTATYTVNSSDTDGNVSFEVTYNVVGESTTTSVTTGNGSVTVDTSPPSITNIITSWGSVLNAAESDIDGTVTITTLGVEDNQVVSLILNENNYLSSPVSSESSTVTIPKEHLAALDEASNYQITADVGDDAGNPANQLISPSFGVDTIIPEMSISSGDVPNGGILNDTEVSLTFSSTDQASGFDQDDIIVSGGSIDDFIPNSDGQTFTAMFSVSAAGDGTYTIDVDPSSFTDAAGNPNSEAPQFTWTSDTTPPTMTIAPNNASDFVSISDGMVTNVQSVSFILESDEQIANFLPEDITLSDGLSYSSGEDITELEAGRRYRIDVESSSQGSKSITIPINSFQDLATNQNNTSVQFSWTYDSSPPVVSSISAKNLENNAINNASTTNDQTIVLEFTTNEPIIGLIGDEIIVSPLGKGTFSALQTLQEDTYRISFNPTSDDTFTFYIDSNSFEDKVGNVNTDASSNFLWSYDNTAPIITVSQATQTLEKGGNFVSPTVTASDNGTDISSEIVVGGDVVDVDVPGTYTITYNVSDAAGNSATEQTHTVTVEDTIAPIITSSNEVVVNENIGTGQVIYTITSNDPNSTFGIKGTDQDEFSVDPTTGELTLLANPDFETKSEYDNIIVTATDEYGNAREMSIIVTIIDVDEISPEANSAVTSTSTSIVIGFSEPIVNNNVTSSDFTISGAISNPTVSLITFSSSSITLSLTDPIAFDETVLISYVQTVGSIDDASGNSLNDFVNQVVTNNLLDNESPIITSPSSVAIDENIGSSQVVYTVNATDNDQISSYEITGGADASSFSIDPVSGEVRLLLDPNFENKSNYLFTVRASDPSNNFSNNFTVTVVINDLDEIPPTLVLNGDSFVTTEAGQPYTEPDPAYTVNDNNGEENVTVELQGVVNTNQIDSYDLVYTATDAAGNETIRTRTVQVADNTPPVITLTPYQQTIYLNVNDSYTLPALTINDFDENPTIVTPDAPDTSRVGVTTLVWIATDNENLTSSITQTVVVGQPPTITLIGDITEEINLGTAFVEPGASAVDYLGADLSGSLVITYSPNDTSTDTVRSFNAHYSVTDSNGVTTNVTRRFDVVDHIIPVLSFTNPTSTSSGSAITWPVKTTYIDPGGVEASDNYDDDTTLVIDKIETVDTNTLNSQNFVYFDTEDSSGNNATQLVRTVQMVDQTPPSVEFDNPSQSELRVVRKGVFTQPVIALSDNYDPSSDIILNNIIRNGNGDIVPVVDTYILDTYTITFSAEDTSGNTTAAGDQITTTITIDPIVDASASSSVVCSGESVTLGSSDTDLQDANGNNYTIEWTSSPDIGVELGNTPIVTAIVTQTTTFTLTLRDSDGNIFSDSSTVRVNPLPSFTVQEDAEICEGSSIDLGIGIVDESSAGYSYRWESDNIGFISSTVNPSYTPISTDTVTLIVTSPAGCQFSDDFTITVVEKPIITFPTGDVFEICEGDTFTITSSLFNVQNSENYSWSVTPQDSGSFETSETDQDVTIFTPNSSGIAARQVQLTLTATDQTPCTGSLSESITLNITPLGTLDISPVNQVICSTDEIELDIVGANFEANTLTPSPSSAIVNTATNKIFYTPTATDLANGFVDISVTADPLAPCSSTIASSTQRIIITPQATVEITNSPIEVCYDTNSPLISLANSGAAVSNESSFEWRVTSGGGNVVGGDSLDPTSWSYDPGSIAIDNETATLELVVTPNSPCPANEVTAQTLVILINKTPEIILNAGNEIFCENDYNEITSSVLQYENISQSDISWSTQTGGLFLNGTSTSPYPFYRPSQTDLQAGFVDLTVVVTPNSGACIQDVTETIRFTVNQTKIVNLGATNVDVCESPGYYDLIGDFITDTSDPAVVFTPTSGISWEILNPGSQGSFDSSTTLNPRFVFGANDIDRGQVTLRMNYDDGSCNDISDTVTLNITRTPFADLGNPIEICAGEQSLLDQMVIRPIGNNNITWSLLPGVDASGVSVPNVNSPTPTLVATADASGTFELVVTITPVDSCGVEITEKVDVTVVEKPIVDLSLVNPDDFEICEGTDFTFSIDDINILTENTNQYTWSSVGNGSFDGLGNPTSSKQRPDSYTLGSEDIARGSVIFRLDVGPESPCPSGDYFSTITIPVSRNPSILGPNEVDLCKTDPLVIDLQNYFNVTDQADFTYQWSTSADGAFTPVDTGGEEALAATYTPSDFEIEQKFVVLTLVASDSNCSTSDTKSITFYFNDPPIVDAGSEEVILCEDAIDYTTEAQITIDPRVTSGYSYVWDTTGDGTFLPSRTELQPRYVPGEQDRLKRKVDDDSVGVVLTLTLVSTSACSVTVDDSVELFFEPKPEVSLPDDFEVCADKSIDLSANVNDHVDLSSYFWTTTGDGTFDDSTSTNSSNPTPTYFPGPGDILAETVEIILNVDGENGCSSSSVEDRLTISLVPPPTAEAGPNTVVCETGGFIHQNNDATATNYSFVQWEIPAQDTNGDGLIDSNDAVGGDFGTINFDNTLIPEFIPGPDALAKLELPNEDDHYVTLQLNAYPTNYNSCNIDSGLCCGVVTDTVKVFIEKNYSVVLPDQKSICEGDVFTLLPNELVIDNIPSYSLLWQAEGPGQLTNFAGNSKTPTYTPQDGQVGNVTITLTITPDNPTTCTGTDPIVETISLFIEPLPIVDAGPTEVFLCEGESYETILANVVPADITKYWNIETGSGSFTDGQDPPSAVSDTNLNLFYTPSQQDYERGFAVLSLNATPEGNCVGEPDVSDMITLRFNQPPTIDIKGEDDGFSTIICDTQTYTYSFANNQVIVDNGFSYKWNTLGDGEFLSSDEILLPEYRAGDLDKQNGTVDLELTVYGSGGCTETKQTIQLTIPTLDVGVDRNLDAIIDPSSSPTSVCINDTLELLANTNLDNYNISWSVDPSNAGLITQGADGLTPEFRPLLTGTVRVNVTISGGDFCDDEDLTDEIVIDVTGLPEITSFPTDQVVCLEDNITITPATVNEFVSGVQWQDYYFTVDNDGNELQALDSLGDPLIGTFSNPTNVDPGLYTPSTSIGDSSDQINVRLTMTASASSPCVSADDTSQSFILTLEPAPEVTNADTLWGDAMLCPDESDRYEIFEAAVLTNASSYAWSSLGGGTWFDPTTLKPSYQPTQDEIDAGEFTIILTVNGNGNCDPIEVPKTIQVISKPEITLSDLEVCHEPLPIDPVQGFAISPDVLLNFAPNVESTTGIKWSTSTSGTFSSEFGDPLNNYSTSYFPSSQDYTNGEVIITLTAYPEQPCVLPVSETMKLILTEQPMVNAGPDQELCEDGTSIQLDGSVTNGSGLLWSTTTNGVFVDSGGSTSGLGSAVYELGSEDYENGSVILTLTGGGNGVCGPQVDNIEIQLIKKPVVEDSIGDLSLCIGEKHEFDEISISNYDFYEWTTNGKGTFEKRQSINGQSGGVPVYTPLPDDPDEGTVYFDLIVSPIDPPCSEQVTYRKAITYVAPLVVEIEEAFEFCEDNPSTSFNVTATVENYSSLQWSRVVGTGTMINTTTDTVEYTPSVQDWRDGSVTLELTAQPQPVDVCGPITKLITIDLIAEPTVDAGNSDTICIDGEYTVTGIEASNYDSFVWNISGGNGTFTTDPNDPTIVKYDPDENDVEVVLTLTLTNEEDPTKPGGCDMVSSDSVTLTMAPKLDVDAGLPQTVCEGEQISLDGTTTNAESVQWAAYYNGSNENVPGVFSPVASEDTTFTPASSNVYQQAIIRGGIRFELTGVSQGSCGVESASVTVTFDPKPVIDAGNDIDICEGDLVELSIVNPTVTAGTNYQWSRINGDGTFSGNITSSVLEPTYTPGPQDIEDGFVVLRLSADPVNACSTITDEDFYDEIQINITRQPTLAFVNDEFFVCAGYEDEVFGPQPTRLEITGVSTNYSENIQWTIISPASGAGDFEPNTDTLINPTFEINSNFSGQIVLQATVTAPGACDNRIDTDGDNDLNDEDQSLVASISQQLVLNVSPTAELEFNNEFENGAGIDVKGEVVCSGSTSYTLDTNASFANIGTVSWSENGSGSIVSGGDTLTPNYVPGAGETGDITFTVTSDATGDCNYTIQRTYTLRIVDEPTVSFNPIATVCSNEDVVITGLSTSSSQLTFESTGTGGIFYDPNDATKASAPTINIPVANQSNYNFSWRYEPSESDILTPGGISIIVRAAPVGDSNCGNDAIDVINIEFSPAPQVSPMLGSEPYSVSICANETLSLDDADVLNASYFSWSTSGSGTFVPSREAKNPVYVPSDDDINLNQTITLTLSALGFENCQQVEESIELTIDQLPIVDIPSTTFNHCEANDSDNDGVPDFQISELNIFSQNNGIVQWTSSSGGEFVIDPISPLTSLGSIYKINDTDIAAGQVTLFVRVYGNGECQDSFDEDEVVIQLSKQPEVSYNYNGAPEFLEICEGEESITLSGTVFTNVDEENGFVWSTTGSGYFDSTTIENPTYFPSQADFNSDEITLKITLSDQGACQVSTDPFEIDLKLIKEPSIVSDQTYFTVCYQDIGTEAIISGVQDITNFSSFQWTVVDGEGDFQDETTFDASDIPLPSYAFNPTYLAQGDDFEGDRKVRVLLTVYPENGCNFGPITKGFEIEFVPQVEAYAGLGGTICSNEPFQISGAEVTNAVSWIWTTSGDGTFNNDELKNPTYTPGTNDIENARLNGTPISLTLTAYGVSIDNDDAQSCLLDSQTINVNVESDITVYAGPDVYLCTDESFIELSNATAEGNPVISWRNDFDNSLVNFDDPTAVKPKYYPTQADLDRGFVTLKMTGESVSGCSQNDFDKITITFVPAVNAVDQNGDPLTSAGEDDSVCAGDTYIVNDAFVNNNSWDSIKWEKVGGYGTLFNINSINPEYRSVNGDQSTVTLKMTVTSKQDGCSAEEFEFFKVLKITGDITGTGSIQASSAEACEGSSVLYSVVGLNDQAVDYIWTIPDGASIISGDGTENILVSFDSYDQPTNAEVSVQVSNNCPGQVRFLNLPIQIKSNPELILTTNNNLGQELCYSDAIQEIEYAFSGGVEQSQISIEWFENGASMGGNSPVGFETSISSNSLIITGNANQAVSQNTEYSYKITAGVSGCSSLEDIKEGSIQVLLSPSLELQNPGSGTDQQTFCEGNPLQDIEYELINGADNVQFQWTSTTVPSGLTQSLSSGVYRITGTPNAQESTSVYTYQITPVNSITGCLGETASGSITVNASSSLKLLSNNSIQPLCEGNQVFPIEYSVGNAVTSIGVQWKKDGVDLPVNSNPPGISYTLANNQLVIGGNLSENISATTVYSYEITPTGGLCGGGGTQSGELTFNPGPRIELSNSSAGFLDQVKCEGELIDDITLNLIDGAENPIVLGLPNGVQDVFDELSGIMTITGELKETNPNDIYNYTVIANSAGGCSTSISGVLTISREDILTPISDVSQTICEGDPIDLIRYEYAGGATGVTLDWFIDGVQSLSPPSGLNVSIANGILTISGTPSANISSNSQLKYIVKTSNSGCTTGKSYEGEITVVAKPLLLLNSGLNNQTVCEGLPITDIVIDAAQGANNAVITWDINPTGLDGQYNGATNQFTISGTPTAVIEDTTYNYSVKAINSVDNCESDIFTGSITVLNGHRLQLLSGSSSVDQSFCETDDLPLPIIYEFGEGASSARALGLPPGLNWSVSGNRLTISGKPTINVSASTANDYTYTVETIGSSCSSIQETGVVSIVPNPIIQIVSGLSTQNVCEDEPIVDIVYNTIDGAEAVELIWDNQPNGIFEDFNSSTGQFTISGTPTGITQDEVYNYTVRALNLSNGCASTELTGSISIQNGHDLKLLSGSTSTNQNICERSELPLDIVYEFGGGANSARVLGLPPGIGWTITGNLITISGTASENISNTTEYEFIVETLGNSCVEETLTGKITINPDAEISLSTPSPTSNQYICEGESIDLITYSFGGGTVDAVPSGLPPGIIGDYNPITRIMTISGTPTQNVEVDTSYNYTVRALNDQGCESPELTGEITVKANAELTLLSSTNTVNQTVCVNSGISDIRIRFENSTVPSTNNMPSGLSSEVVGTDVLRIYGSVSVGGPYTFDVIGTNTNGCSSTAVTVDLNVVPDYAINPSKVVTDMNDPNNGFDESLIKNISCYGNRDGEIQVSLSNTSNSLSYIYSWSGPNNYANTTQSNHIKNLQPGNYTVSVFPQGNSDCPVTESFTIVQPQPTDISVNTISPVSCTGSDDGLISVSISGGNSFYYKNYIWETLREDENCVTYSIRLRDTDNDGIFDIEDADIDNDGVIDPNKTDFDLDGKIDAINNSNFSYSIVSYQSCDGTFITDNKQNLNEFSSNGVYQICAIPNSVSPDANLDHDQDPNTPEISSVVVSGGTSSCSSGTWQKIDRLKGTTYADNLTAGLYRLTVVEGPNLADIESLSIDELRNNPDVCLTDQVYELPKDQILYGSVRVDEAYCSLSGGYIDIDVNQSAGEVFFYYDGVRVQSSDVNIIAAEFGINTHRVLISNPVSEATFEIRNANGCGVVVADDLLDTSVLAPIITYTSPELEKYGTVSERSNVLFTLANNMSYHKVEWDFGDASPIVTGERVSHQYFADGTYTVTVFVYNASGCFTTTTEEIVVGKGYTILMPNAFSPNGDNINEILGPVFTGLKAVEYYIYNSKGVLIYQEFVSEDNLSPNGTIEIMGWDGENSDPSSNFYVYKIIGTRINEELVTRTGTVFLIE